MDIVTIDFETYYDQQYSLSKMTTEAYVRDERFEVIGVAIKVNDQEVDWYSGKDPGGFLHAMDYSDKAILCHNTVFDGAILSWHYGIKPKFWLDTLSMARPLHSMTVGGSLKALATYYKLGEKGDEVMRTIGLRRRDFTPEQMQAFADYCVQDVDLTYRLFKKMARQFPKEELLVIDQTIRMYTEPKLVLDPVVLDAHLTAIHERKEKLLNKLGGEEKAKKFLMSNNKFADLLRAFGVEPPMKTSPTTGKQTYAFAKNDTEFTALLEHPNPAVRTVVEARLGTKSTIEETRTKRFLEISERGPLPIMLNYYGAHTGRFSGCLVADTVVEVFDVDLGVIMQKRIVDVLPDDLVWDGEDYVEHDGVVFSGYREVIEWDGITGTEEHVVFTADGEISLAEAKALGSRITPAPSPTAHGVDSARVSGAE